MPGSGYQTQATSFSCYAGVVPDPVLTFNTQQERFDQRFAAFHTLPLVRPEPMGYGERKHGLLSTDVTFRVGQNAYYLHRV
jgi:hypothetical protein